MSYWFDGDTEEVIKFLLENPSEMERVRVRMKVASEAADRKRLEALQPKAPVKMVSCNTYGCVQPKPEGAIFCGSCYQDYLEDPDAYK